MKRFFITIAALLGFAGAAEACPDYTLWGAETYNLSGQQLFERQQFSITAGGESFLPNCGFSSNQTGYFTTAPDFSLDLSGMGNYRVVIDVVSNCDAALLVNTASTDWYYDDDSNGNADPRIDIANPGDGVLDIWVGTFDGAYCDAVLSVETF